MMVSNPLGVQEITSALRFLEGGQTPLDVGETDSPPTAGYLCWRTPYPIIHHLASQK
ncbi:hypothetical protein DESC_180015 [Desulfosarcina cetonica]|nr:hypothetical protein DESC_180015 [Desulfosarcina cetonica]